MHRILLSLDEVDRVKRLNHITSYGELEKRTGVHRNTWSRAIAERKPTEAVLQALAGLGARPSKLLVSADLHEDEVAA